MKTTKYFEERVLPKRPYIRREWCQQAIEAPEFFERQPDGRVRFWIYVSDLGRYLRVVTLEDGETNSQCISGPAIHKEKSVKVHYDRETDSLYIDLSSRPGVDADEVSPGVVLDFDSDGKVVGIDVQHASSIVDLKALDTDFLPLGSSDDLNDPAAPDR